MSPRGGRHWPHPLVPVSARVDAGMEEDEDDGSEEHNSGFPPNERRIVTQAYDLSVTTLLEQWDNNDLVLPEIQREYVWDLARASRLVESLLLNIPIPVLYFAELENATYEIIDGHQRVRSIVRFLKNEFALGNLSVLSDLRGRRFHQLPKREQRFLKTRSLRAIVITAESHPNMKFEVFERLNTGSISLNAQELRNSVYRGPFNDLLKRLAQNAHFRAMIGQKAPRKRMVDEELILRFFALRTSLPTYRPSLKRVLNTYMNGVRSAPQKDIENLAELFEGTVERLHSVVGVAAFRPTSEEGNATEKNVNRALFDAEMLAFSWLERGPRTAAQRGRVVREIHKLYQDADFLDAIQRATGDRSRMRRRVRKFVDALNRAGLDCSPPFALEEEPLQAGAAADAAIDGAGYDAGESGAEDD